MKRGRRDEAGSYDWTGKLSGYLFGSLFERLAVDEWEGVEQSSSEELHLRCRKNMEMAIAGVWTSI